MACASPPRSAYSLLELVVGMTASAAILGGVSASIYVASQAVQQGGGDTGQRIEADDVLDRVLADVKHARSFSEQTANAVTFTVPDRNGDGVPETIRYAWSGTPGDPLTYQFNGSSEVALAEDVHQFNLAALTRTMIAPVIPPAAGGDRLLLVVGNAAGLTAAETAHRSLVESWGYVVELIDDDDDQAAYDTAVSGNDVVLITNDITASSLGTKLSNATIGVVTSECNLSDEFGMAASIVWESGTDVQLYENNHYITSPFLIGNLPILTSSQSLAYVDGNLSPDLDQLAKSASGFGIVSLPAGAEAYDAGTIAGRRVQLPWGGNGFDPNSLTTDGQTILKRSLEWAAGAGDATPPPRLLFVSGGSLVTGPPTYEPIVTPTAQEQTRIDLIESWGYSTTLIHDSDTQANYDFAAEACDVAYISSEVNIDLVDVKPAGFTIGIVNERSHLIDVLGFADWYLGFSTTELDLQNNSHYITEPFSIGALPIFTASQTGVALVPPLSPDLNALGKLATSSPALGTLEQGAARADVGTVPGRRVALPWATPTFDFNQVTADGLTIMQRSIEWAAGMDGGGGGGPAPDANFGYETQFAGSFSPGQGMQVGTQVTLPEDGTINSITAYINPGGGGKDYRFALYADNAGEPGNLIVETAVGNEGGTGWKTITVTPTSLTAGTYWLALSFSHNTQKYYYESSGGVTRHERHPAVSNGFIATWPGSTTPYSHKISIYGTYTPSN